MRIELLRATYICTKSLNPKEVVTLAIHDRKGGKRLLEVLLEIFRSRMELAQGPFRARIFEIAERSKRLKNLKKLVSSETTQSIRDISDQILSFRKTLPKKTVHPASSPSPARATPSSSRPAKASSSSQRASTGASASGRISPGLVNGGNWCYANSVIKFLLSSPVVSSLLDSLPAPSPIAVALRNVRDALNQPGAVAALSVDKPPLKQFFDEAQKLFPSLSSHTPQDAQELLTCLLDAIGYAPVPITYHRSHQGAFIGQDTQSLSIIPFHLGELPQKSGPGASLDALIHRSSAQHENFGTTPIESSMTFQNNPPPVLFFQLIRYHYPVTKQDTTPVGIPLEVKIARQDTGEEIRYRFRSAVIQACGHYVAIERNDRGEWIRHDDQNVHPVTEAQAKDEIQKHGALFSYELMLPGLSTFERGYFDKIFVHGEL